ncbi:AraC family transcriptional regulator [Nocardioides oleivorans]|uniref:AraC family transcriptional regulator n=1 Tax=Nocardioides oleivorans TaxID=273676 RepID=A0A4Q2RXK5_9ACTN|nr:AraC family transcriptional regulator [Nocardioides oleivorans]RYB93877.1 AraC family transcriptional regulator [Nocardioides oleivorans]
MTLARSAALRGFHSLVLELGGDPDAIARDVGLDPSALHSDELLVPERAVASALELGARRTDCPDLGLRVAARQELSMLGPLALALQSSATVGDALECCSRYLSVHSRSVGLTVEADPYGDKGVVALRWNVPGGGDLATVQATDLSLGFAHGALRSVTGEGYGLRTVDLPHEPVADPETYRAYFGTEVRFRRPAALLRVPSSLMRQPVAGEDAVLKQLAIAYLDRLSPSGPGLVAARVRTAVAQALGTSPVTITAIADLFSVHPRTLQRQLAREDTSFVDVVDGVRKEAAQKYLRGTDLPFAQVAALLDLSEHSVLTRCCRRWWDETPTQVRQRGAAPS